jgi:hypothetical protein
MPRNAASIETWRSGAETALGCVLALSPVTFWIAWTPSLLLGAMAAAVVCGALLGLLHDRGASREGAGSPRPAGRGQPVLPDGFVEEIHRIFPLTYHHSNVGRRRFRSAMENLRVLLGTPKSRE